MTDTTPFHAGVPCVNGEAERLVVEGLRRWIAGYQTGSIACWELAWNLYAEKLGVERARPVMTGIGCYARALNGFAKCGFCLLPYDCKRRCPHEALAVGVVAAWQCGDREAASGIVEELVVGAGLPATLEAAAHLADNLRRVDLTLSSGLLRPSVSSLPSCTHSPVATRH
ncbi:hypothetical protein [Stappia sp. ES.058]|uniref:hypothetical protein n=1 Tax=Stappia sp. ES.058 TaxID=1881061 RepID=UPI00087BCEE7|nr:hypothetical protein [Stappia sp. ES.058]SDU48557.1 hypothetical protein SAMN05428979_4283 [Stappia sp. ES.058]